MFSVHQKRAIADAVQGILRATHHPELPLGEIQFKLHVDGGHPSSWADIQNNGAVLVPGVNPHNEAMAAIAERPQSAVADKLRRYTIAGGFVQMPHDFGLYDLQELIQIAAAPQPPQGEAQPLASGRATPTQATHRWNLDHLPDGSIRICEGDHHRSADCEWVHYVREVDQPVHTIAALRAERDQYRNDLGNLLTAIDNWRKMSPLYGAGGGDDSVGTPTQQAGA